MVKTFLWKACSDILPTKELLFRRHVTLDPLCPICGLESETIGHILWNCPSANDVWLECDCQIQNSTSDVNDFIFIFQKLLDRLDPHQMHIVATVARQLWLKRNSFVFNGEFLSPSSLVRQALEQVDACLVVEQRMPATEVVSRPPSAAVWQKPGYGWFKFNWDAALDVPRNKMGIGGIVRNHDGLAIAMFCAVKQNISDPTMVEAFGAWKAVDTAVQLGLRRVMFEGDSLIVVNALLKDEDCWSLYGQVLNDARAKLNGLGEWEILHVRRVANVAAHNLARLALTMDEDRLWREGFPAGLQDL